MKRESNAGSPLSHASLQILVALAEEDLHGYAIMKSVFKQSRGRYKLGPGTLYDNLQKLLQQGFVEELGPRAGDDDARRQYYRLTPQGKASLIAEVSRLEEVIREARLRLHAVKPRRA